MILFHHRSPACPDQNIELLACLRQELRVSPVPHSRLKEFPFDRAEAIGAIKTELYGPVHIIPLPECREPDLPRFQHMQDQPAVGCVRHAEAPEPSGPDDPGTDKLQPVFPDLPRPFVEDHVVDASVFRARIYLLEWGCVIYAGLDDVRKQEPVLRGAGSFRLPGKVLLASGLAFAFALQGQRDWSHAHARCRCYCRQGCRYCCHNDFEQHFDDFASFHFELDFSFTYRLYALLIVSFDIGAPHSTNAIA